jgi:hypothetical protein
MTTRDTQSSIRETWLRDATKIYQEILDSINNQPEETQRLLVSYRNHAQQQLAFIESLRRRQQKSEHYEGAVNPMAAPDVVDRAPAAPRSASARDTAQLDHAEPVLSDNTGSRKRDWRMMSMMSIAVLVISVSILIIGIRIGEWITINQANLPPEERTSGIGTETPTIESNAPISHTAQLPMQPVNETPDVPLSPTQPVSETPDVPLPLLETAPFEEAILFDLPNQVQGAAPPASRIVIALSSDDGNMSSSEWNIDVGESGRWEFWHPNDHPLIEGTYALTVTLQAADIVTATRQVSFTVQSAPHVTATTSAQNRFAYNYPSEDSQYEAQDIGPLNSLSLEAIGQTYQEGRDTEQLWYQVRLANTRDMYWVPADWVELPARFDAESLPKITDP